ncbi:MAG: hypothetical protein IH945_05170 [Armatimonadetes bacterium]|nr:hypothetical protein [Armatimonadota bacterium]
MVRPAFLLVATCLLGGCTKGPGVQESEGSGSGAAGIGIAADVLGAEGHAQGASIIDRVRHADAHYAEADLLLLDLIGPEHSALLEIEETAGIVRQLLHSVLPMWEELQRPSGRFGDSNTWDDALKLLSWAALDAYDAHQMAEELLEDSPEMERLVEQLKHASDELGEIVVAMGGSVEYY